MKAEKMKYPFVLVLVFFLFGCGYWKKTKDIYRGYALPAKVNLQKEADLSCGQGKLANLFCPMDIQLEQLIRKLKTQVNEPDANWAQETYQNFTWLNGIIVSDNQGNIRQAYPEHKIKDIDWGQMIHNTDNWPRSFLQLKVQNTDLGPELSLLRPYFQDNELQGVIAAHFDPRTWVQFCSSPQDLAILYKGIVLWNGRYNETSRKLVQLDWDEKLENDVQGELDLHNDRFFWMARYIGQEPIVYLVESEE